MLRHTWQLNMAAHRDSILYTLVIKLLMLGLDKINSQGRCGANATVNNCKNVLRVGWTKNIEVPGSHKGFGNYAVNLQTIF